MKLKKLSALCGLLSILFMLLHMCYSVFAYLTFYYNPVLKNIFAYPFMALVCIHAVLGMITVFTMKDGSRTDLYPKLNIRTILQRVSAALIFPLLILHINTFSLMQKSAQSGKFLFIYILIAAEIIFFGCVITHICVSLTNGLITLGILKSVKTQKILDRTVYIAGALFFTVSVYAVVNGQAAMFLKG